MNQKIIDLQQQIETEKIRIKNCSHNYTEPIYDPESVSEGYGYKLIGQGSDTWGDFEGYKIVMVPRWSRCCLICHNIEFTYEQEPIIKSYKPKF